MEKVKTKHHYHTCGGSVRWVAISAMFHLLMVYLPYLLAKWLESLQAKNISKKVLSLASWNLLSFYPLPFLPKSLLARGIKGWQVAGSEPATALKFPKRDFLGWLIKLCALAYRSFPGFKEEREKGREAKAKQWKCRGKKSKNSQTHLCLKKREKQTMVMEFLFIVSCNVWRIKYNCICSIFFINTVSLSIL